MKMRNILVRILGWGYTKSQKISAGVGRRGWLGKTLCIAFCLRVSGTGKETFYKFLMKTTFVFIYWQVLCRYRPKWNLDLQFRPFFLGGIMAGSGIRLLRFF